MSITNPVVFALRKEAREAFGKQKKGRGRPRPGNTFTD